MMVRIVFLVAFLISVFVSPWWLTMLLGVFLLALFEASITVIAGGLLMDTTFGTPLVPLGGFPYLYTAIFIMLALLSWYLHRTLSE